MKANANISEHIICTHYSNSTNVHDYTLLSSPDLAAELAKHNEMIVEVYTHKFYIYLCLSLHNTHT